MNADPQTIRFCRILGEDLAAARKVRRMSTVEASQRLGVARPTLQRMEEGDPGVGLGLVVRAAILFGLEKNLSEVFAPERDPEALRRLRQSLPQRVRESGPSLDVEF
jgi:transcriptional regulator with XRE-family HTH domain